MMPAWRSLRGFSTLICGSMAALIAMAAPSQAQTVFTSPSEASAALVEAARRDDMTRLRRIMGVAGRQILSSGDPVADRADRLRFVAAYDSRHALSQKGDKATLLVGEAEYPFPIPLARTGGGWRFDAAAGREEVLARRIGRNELAAIQASLAIVDAQQDYAAKDRTGQGRGVYAQRIVSRAGSKDGLYWPAVSGEEPSPLGALAAQAAAEGYQAGGTGQPFHGYLYKILSRQGQAAPGGSLDYVAGGQMIGGFALLAYPAEYGRSGIMSFIVNHLGTVYQKDLGAETARAAARMRAFNPEKGWEKVQNPNPG